MDSYIIYRILGNDLPPRHKKGQTYINTKFILDNEPCLSGCRKKWIVNHILDKHMEQQILELLKSRGQSFIHIPFNKTQFKKQKWPEKYEAELKYAGIKMKTISCYDYMKLLYIINLNQARNIGIAEGKKMADWILPLDGNCILTPESWEMVIKKTQNTEEKYLFLNMFRLCDNKQYFNFDPADKVMFEPQILFHKTSEQIFNEDYCWGRRSKVELLLRLGLKVENKSYFTCKNELKNAGYVLRLFSGVPKGEGHPDIRGELRKKAIKRVFFKLEGLKRLFV